MNVNYECFEDREVQGQWRVEGVDIKSGDVYVTVFAGSRAAERARQYYFFVTEAK